MRSQVHGAAEGEHSHARHQPVHYFTSIVDEVAATNVGDDYWKYVHSKTVQLERRWIETHGWGHSRPEDEMMETK